MAGDRKEKIGADYFRLPHKGLAVLVLFGLYVMLMAGFDPARFPGYLGPVTTFGRYLGFNHPFIAKTISVLCFVCHGYECTIAHKFCRKLNLNEAATIKWIISTFIFGFPSLMHVKAAAEKKVKVQG